MKSINESKSLKDKQMVTFDSKGKQNFQTVASSLLVNELKNSALINTGIILITDSHLNKIRLRSILESETTINVLTESACWKLNLK